MSIGIAKERDYVPPEVVANNRLKIKIALASDEVLKRYVGMLKRIEDNTAENAIRRGSAYFRREDAEGELEFRAKERSFLGRALRFFRIPIGEKIII